MNELRKFELESLYQSFKNDENTYLHTAYVEADNKVHYYTDDDVRDYSKEYFTIESLDNENSIIWKRADSYAPARTLEISTDLGKTWNSFTSSLDDVVVAVLNKGERLWARGNNDRFSDNSGHGSRFFPIHRIKVYGNIMSIVTKNNFSQALSLSSQYYFKSFFTGCASTIIDAKNLILPATTLTTACYDNMFKGCVNLLYAPKTLPAITLAQNCYYNMFSGCTSLLTTPEICGITYGAGACQNMFYQCKNIKEVKFPSNVTCSGNQIFYRMCRECSNLEKIPELLNVTISSGSETFSEAFHTCPKLEGPIEIHLTNPGTKTFYATFYGCSKLNNVTLDSTIWYETMFFNCYNLSDFTVITSPTTVYNQVFAGTQVILNNSDITNVTTHEGRYYTVSDVQNLPLYNEDIMLFWGNSSNNIFIPTNYSTEAFDLIDRVLTLKVATVAPQQQNNWNYIYYNCTKVQGTDVTLIKEHAFKGFKDLEEIDLPNAWIASQGWNTLQNCSKLKKVKLAGIDGTGGEYLFNYSGVIVEIVEFTKACDVTGKGAAAGANHATWPNKAMKIVLPDDLCSIRSTAAFSKDTIFYVSSQAKIQEYLAYSNWATIGAERFKLKSELEE